jgi:hypothetical protein
LKKLLIAALAGTLLGFMAMLFSSQPDMAVPSRAADVPIARPNDGTISMYGSTDLTLSGSTTTLTTETSGTYVYSIGGTEIDGAPCTLDGTANEDHVIPDECVGDGREAWSNRHKPRGKQ